MKGLCILAVILALLSGCTDTGPVAPKEGRISIGGRLAQPIIESGRVSVSKPETVKNWSTSYANARNNRPHVRMAENMKCTHRVSIGKGKSDSSLTLAGPIIVDNTIYTLDSEFVLQATDLTTAKSMWRKKLADIQGTTTKSIGLSRNRDRLYAVAGNGLIVSPQT